MFHRILFSTQELKSFKLEVDVPSKYHTQIIGRKGAIISKIRDEHSVNIKFPEKGSEEPDQIIIVGYEENANAAKKDILARVHELVWMKFRQLSWFNCFFDFWSVSSAIVRWIGWGVACMTSHRVKTSRYSLAVGGIHCASIWSWRYLYLWRALWELQLFSVWLDCSTQITFVSLLVYFKLKF